MTFWLSAENVRIVFSPQRQLDFHCPPRSQKVTKMHIQFDDKLIKIGSNGDLKNRCTNRGDKVRKSPQNGAPWAAQIDGQSLKNNVHGDAWEPGSHFC